MKIHIKCSEFGWVKNVTERRRGGGIPFYRVGIERKEKADEDLYSRFPKSNSISVPRRAAGSAKCATILRQSLVQLFL